LKIKDFPILSESFKRIYGKKRGINIKEFEEG
jgi:hypothetical protein